MCRCGKGGPTNGNSPTNGNCSQTYGSCVTACGSNERCKSNCYTIFTPVILFVKIRFLLAQRTVYQAMQTV